MTRYVRSAAGVRRFHEPIGSPIGEHPRLKSVLRGHNVKGVALNAGTETTPINVHGNVMLAAKLIAQGKHVRLNKVDQIGTLLTDLLKMSGEAKRKHETLDLCRVSVPKTNLFCAQNKGIDRINMPQLAGVPQPGSKAAELQARTTANHPGGEVDLTKQFEEALRSHGVKVTDTTLPAASFKASQDQLIGDKVAGIEKFMETAPKDSPVFEPIFVTRDHYIIDGHHRWAAMVALDAKDGVLGNFPMKVRMVDMEIGEALAAANAFAEDWGIGHEGVTKTGPTVSKFANLSKVRLKDIDLAYNPAERRDSKGRWTKGGGVSVKEVEDAIGGNKAPTGPLTEAGLMEANKGILLKQIAAIGSARTRSNMFGDMSGEQAAAEGKARNAVSSILNNYSDLYKDKDVRSALKNVGLGRMVSGYDYQQTRTAKDAAATDAMLKKREANRRIREAKERQKVVLEALNEAVSDYEFATMFGDNTESGSRVRTILAENPGIEKTPKGRALLKGHPELSGIKPTYKEQARDYDWDAMDKSGGFPEDARSMHEEHVAQTNAEFWHDTLPEDAPDEEHYARSLWEQYQNPDLYGYINRTLREGVKIQEPDMDGPSPEDLRHYVGVMFDKAGTTTDVPMTLYRAIRSSDEPGHDWASNFKPGSTFTDKGIMSCTAHGKFAQGWLALDPHGKEVDAEKPNDVVLEIHAPAGQRIVGGSAQFIESMLPPDTTLKIISNEKRTAKTPRNPLGDFGLDPFDYTHVVAEVVKK